VRVSLPSCPAIAFGKKNRGKLPNLGLTLEEARKIERATKIQIPPAKIRDVDKKPFYPKGHHDTIGKLLSRFERAFQKGLPSLAEAPTS